MHLVLFKYLYLQNYDSYKKYKNGFEIYIKFCFRRMYFYKKVEIEFFFKYSDFGQGESILNESIQDTYWEGDRRVSITIYPRIKK